MTNEYSKVRLKYRGKLNKIKNKFIKKNIAIEIKDNVWKLKLN